MRYFYIFHGRDNLSLWFQHCISEDVATLVPLRSTSRPCTLLWRCQLRVHGPLLVLLTLPGTWWMCPWQETTLLFLTQCAQPAFCAWRKMRHVTNSHQQVSHAVFHVPTEITTSVWGALMCRKNAWKCVLHNYRGHLFFVWRWLRL